MRRRYHSRTALLHPMGVSILATVLLAAEKKSLGVEKRSSF
ncbi:unnamed protein product [Linum tenue]|uniref:Uncharacterized protein n=1 Tax=Linum tenue TaxID=586396 RepID=A0AAV0LVU2_9ROSI|nr:unnamed protein product [Linum tenue]